jgi:hypothetical protein
MTKPLENVLDLPILERAEVALNEAVRKLKIDHARRGLPIHIWEDGKVVEISADQLRAELGLDQQQEEQGPPASD